MSIARYLGVASSAALLAYCALQMFGPDGEIVVRALWATPPMLLASLASVGTLLGRAPQGYACSLFAGALGTIDSLTTLAMGREQHGMFIGIAYVAASLVTLVCGFALDRAADQHAPKPPALSSLFVLDKRTRI